VVIIKELLFLLEYNFILELNLMTDNSTDTKQSKSWYNLILHLHPRKVKLSTLDFTLTFGLGGMAALLIVIQVLTGLLLKFHYVPSPDGAYNSVLDINNNLLFGKLAHNIHHWSALLLLMISFLHMLRVLFTGAYSKPRHATWIFGFLLLILVVLSNFTGYLLPWDQLSYWAVTISTSLLQYIPLIGGAAREALLGGNEVGSATLSNFFNLHTGIIPLLMIIFMGYHFWKIRRAGGVIVSEQAKDGPLVDTQPNLVARELVVALVLIASLLVLSIIFDAPLRERANPSFSPNPAKAPWYFMGLQELLMHFHPLFAIVVIPVTVLIAALRLPYINIPDINKGIWFLSENGRKSGIVSMYTGFILTIIFILLSEFLPDPEALIPSIPGLITTGLIPSILVTGSIFYFVKYLRRNFTLNRSELIQSIVIIMVTSYTVLSITGIFFRGEGMKLMWPWQL
jgi:quinol-cytochrome oxidoreductase complex cytochrome b subunit